MAVCLDYQSVYCRRQSSAISLRAQIVAAAFLLATLVGKVWLTIQTTDLGYRVARERQRTIELDMERRELELELSVLLRPDRLAKAAGAKLGLGPLDPKQARKVYVK